MIMIRKYSTKSDRIAMDTFEQALERARAERESTKPLQPGINNRTGQPYQYWDYIHALTAFNWAPENTGTYAFLKLQDMRRCLDPDNAQWNRVAPDYFKLS